MPEPVRVFVSHSHEDNDFGVRLVGDLRRALGSDDAVWYDASGGLKGGDEWWGKIVGELTARPVIILVLSPAALASPWVTTEFTLALKQYHSPTGKRIIPVLYKPCEPRADMTLFQMVSFLVPRQYHQALGELLSALGVSNTPPPEPQRPRPEQPPNTSPIDQGPPPFSMDDSDFSSLLIEFEQDWFKRRTPLDHLVAIASYINHAIRELKHIYEDNDLRLRPDMLVTLLMYHNVQEVEGHPLKIRQNQVDLDDLATFARLTFELTEGSSILGGRPFYIHATRTLQQGLRAVFEEINRRISSPQERRENQMRWEALFRTLQSI